MIDTIINSFEVWTDAQGIKSKTRVKSVENISLEGIIKLRELILQLAVSGKLVPQNPNDEPASELIKKIVNRRKKLVKDGENYSQKQISVISKEEEPFQLPNGWTWARLPEIAEYNTGRTPSTKNPEYWSDKENGIPWISISDMSDFGYINDSSKFVSSEASKKVFSENPVPAGTILMSFKLTIGKISILNIEAYHNEAIISINPFEEIDKEYLFKILPKRAREGNSKNALMGNTLNATSLALLLIPIPPLSEQQRIRAKVDELMALCAKLEAERFNNLKTHQVLVKTLLKTLTQAADAKELEIAWERMAEHFDTLFCTEDSIEQLKQTILQLAVMGKLVKQDLNDEPASELLKKIATEKERLVNKKKLKKQKTLLTITDDAQPFIIPKSWAWVPWGSILAYEDYPFKRGPFGSSLKKDMFIESGYKVYEQYCPINDDCSFERYYISDELYKKLEGFAVKADDYLVSCSGATLGRITQVPNNFKEGIINQALLRVRMNHEYVDKDFFKLMFRSPYFQKMIFDNSSGSAIPNVKGVNDLKIMPVPFLAVEEQQRIVKKVEQLYNICDNLKERIVNSQKIKNILSKTIIEKTVE